MMMKAPLQILSLAVQERDVMKKALILILAVILAGCGTARPVTHTGSPMQQADEVRARQDIDESTRKAKAQEKESPAGDVAKSTATGAAVGTAAGPITGDFDRGLAVGALLPLSGKQAAMGNRVLDGLIAGLGLFDRRRAAPVELRIENYGSDPAAVNRAVAKLTDEVRVLAIIGPPEFEAARVAAKAAQSAQVPLLALSPVVASEGPRDFVFSDQRSDEREARTMASYAVKDLGLSRLVVFYPENAYGDGHDERLPGGGPAPGREGPPRSALQAGPDGFFRGDQKTGSHQGAPALDEKEGGRTGNNPAPCPRF